MPEPMISKPDTCFFHFPCLDGFGAALVVEKRWPGEIDFRPANYPDDFDLTVPEGSRVLFVDFWPGAKAVDTLVDNNCRVTVIDHHKTAAAQAEGAIREGYVDGVFDMERSGAGLAWDVLFAGKPRPLLVEFLEDRDLWRWKLEHTAAVHAYMASLPYDFDRWAQVMETLDTSRSGRRRVVDEGQAILRAHDKTTTELIEYGTQWWTLGEGNIFRYMPHDGVPPAGDVRVPVVNVPYTMASEVGHKLLQLHREAPFAATYWDNGPVRRWSLRSEDGRWDVSEIARTRGGGGHRNAAGFETER